MIREMYHTQEKRRDLLTSPIKCTNKQAWLGEGYYFWFDEEDAIRWGTKKKCRGGYYQIYIANIESDSILDTVFSEKHYFFWLKQIEKVALKFIKKTGVKPTLKQINDYFKERGTWDEVDGILFQDIPENNEHSLVLSFYYRKRIQIVIYNINVIKNFRLDRNQKC